MGALSHLTNPVSDHNRLCSESNPSGSNLIALNLRSKTDDTPDGGNSNSALTLVRTINANLNQQQAIKIQENFKHMPSEKTSIKSLDVIEQSESVLTKSSMDTSPTLINKMSFRYTVPAFEFAPEICHDQNYDQICDLFRSFRVQSSFN